MPRISVVVPAHNEAENLPVLYSRLCGALDPVDPDWELLVIDDHSSDRTFAVLQELAKADRRVSAIRLSRNHGSHLAICCGLQHSTGDCAVVLAADLQDPPEFVPELMQAWEQGAQVVWAARRRREGERSSTIGFALVYYWIMRKIVGIQSMPATGADFVLLDRKVVAALSQFRENNVSVMALLTWMGFRQTTLTYDKQARLHGRSSWNLEKKLKLVADSVVSFSYLPIRVMSYLGAAVALAGFLYALHVIRFALTGHPAQGWASLMVVVLVLGGLQMLMMGVLGEYLWRAFDESRRRPMFLIEDWTTNIAASTVIPKDVLSPSIDALPSGPLRG